MRWKIFSIKLMPLKPNCRCCISGTTQPSYASSTNNERASHPGLDAQTLDLISYYLKSCLGITTVLIQFSYTEYA
jgi:hypothetical protein